MVVHIELHEVVEQRPRISYLACHSLSYFFQRERHIKLFTVFNRARREGLHMRFLVPKNKLCHNEF